MSKKLAWLALLGALSTLGGCVVVPAQPGYVAGPPVVVSPPPVVVRGYWYYGPRYRRW